MRKALLLLFILFAQMGFAQIERTVVFDFSKPTTLTPSVTPVPVNYGQVDITETVFTAGPVTLSFERGELIKVGAKLQTGIVDGKHVHYVLISRDTKTFINIDTDRLLRFSFYGTSVGGFGLAAGGGTLSYDSQCGTWEDTPYVQKTDLDSPIQSVTLDVLSTNYPCLDSMVVTYIVKQDILTPATDVDFSSTLDTFQDLNLTFDRVVKVANVPLQLVDKSGKTYPVHMKRSDNVVMLHCEELIYLSGEYTLSIPEKTFVSEDGIYYNPALEYTFVVVEAANTLTVVGSTPAVDEQIEELPSGIKLTFRKEIGGLLNTSNVIQILDEEGNLKRSAKPVLLDDDFYSISIEYTRAVPITEEGVYALRLPEGLVYDMGYNGDEADYGVSHGAKYNPFTELKYYVKVTPPNDDDPNQGGGDNPNPGDDDPPTPPAPQPMENVSPELRSQVYAMLALTGVGYPAPDSEARKALESLSLSPDATDDVVRNAIIHFYEEKVIIQPGNKQHYKIANVDADGRKIYLKCADGEVTLTRNEDEACSFIALAQEDGTTVFYTTDGYYLHSLMNTNIYSGTSKKNVTSTLSEVNMLRLKRFELDGVSPIKTFGLVSIYGMAGRRGDVPVYTHSLINTEAMEIDMDTELLYFSNTMSSAFCIEEIERPVYQANYTITPSDQAEVASLEAVIVSFKDLHDVVLADAEGILLTRSDGATFTPSRVEPVDEASCTYQILFDELPRGSYVLTMAEGTFTFQGAMIQAIKANYKVTNGYDFVYDLFTRYQVSVPPYDNVEDYQVTDYYVTMYGRHMVVKPTTIGIYSYWRGTKVAEGRFGNEKDVYATESRLNPETGMWEDVSILVSCTMHFIPDFKVEPGSLQDGTYIYVIPAGTFGDENYGKYLRNPNSISKTECHVNEEIRFYVYVVNGSNAIIGTEVGGEQTSSVYDLSGRKVDLRSMKQGMYIRDGKKVILK